jgi:hypothetical protein
MVSHKYAMVFLFNIKNSKKKKNFGKLCTCLNTEEKTYLIFIMLRRLSIKLVAIES